MKERPVLFKGEMVRALLAGAKLQTRREVKIRGADGHKHTLVADGVEPSEKYPGEFIPWRDGEAHYSFPCPFGLPGDHLWVRETWTIAGPDGETYFRYRADADGGERQSWRPSIFMPRAASRLSLEITDVRVERLQQISTEDCIAEGLSTQLREHDAECHLRDQYRDLWCSINGKDSWQANPWVWCISFRRLERS